MTPIEQRVQELTGRASNHDKMFEMLIMLMERQQKLLEEIRRDAQQTQNLWVKLAGRHGWLDDLD